MLRGAGIAVARRLVGNYITSLEMAGCSITLLRADDEMLALWDDPVLTPGAALEGLTDGRPQAGCAGVDRRLCSRSTPPTASA